jgi:hypothetical protein
MLIDLISVVAALAFFSFIVWLRIRYIDFCGTQADLLAALLSSFEGGEAQ